VFLLENHGALSVGPDVYKAYYRMESLELFAKISLIANQLGNVNVIDEGNVKKILDIRKQWGMDSIYPGCKVNGDFIKDGAAPAHADSDSTNNNSFENITMKKDELIELVTSVVNNILNKNV